MNEIKFEKGHTSRITFNDSYQADGFQEGVNLISRHLSPYGLRAVASFIEDADEEYAYDVFIMKKRAARMGGC